MRGRPKALDPDKQSTICSLVLSGVSLRQAAHFVGCDPNSIRRELKRNNDFRTQLAKAKSEARIHPLETLSQAARSNWRAALAWMERLDPDRFANPSESIVTKREANKFVDSMVESIEATVKSPRQRENLYDLLEAAMPTAMRRRWEIEARGRAIDQIEEDIEERKLNRSQKTFEAKAARNQRRYKLYEELAPHLPDSIRRRLWDSRELLDPEEFFAPQQEPGADNDDASATSDVEDSNDSE